MPVYMPGDVSGAFFPWPGANGQVHHCHGTRDTALGWDPGIPKQGRVQDESGQRLVLALFPSLEGEEALEACFGSNVARRRGGG